MRFRARLFARAATAAAGALLLAGCGSTPAEELEDWWSSGGESSVKALSDASSGVSSAYPGPTDSQKAACEKLLAAVAKAKKLDAIPSDNARDFWTEALSKFEHGGSECVAGIAKNHQPQTGEGIREVLSGISRLASAVSMIRNDLDAK